ncbi:uncharacterized protein LOC116853637 [Odontomachus brunneus]|uniref:uncharacterized protein LOC116853637 n=1 Tax=Odontomachus brunneus TaxID=486640 RepID=UPI0013F1C752|nr:uncharacterized protein LOC116853637 [Odontomachus brunneus]
MQQVAQPEADSDVATKYVEERVARMFRDISQYVKRCKNCMAHKASQMQPPGKLHATAVQKPWEQVSLDLIGPLPRSKKGYTWILAMQDRFSKWIEIKPLRQATASAVAQGFLEEIIYRHGCPDSIISDNGTQFKSGNMRKITKDLGIQHRWTPVWTPQCNPVERANRTIKTMISQYVGEDHRNWDENLSQIKFAFNTAQNEDEAINYNLPVSGDRSTLIDSIMSHLDRYGPVDDFLNSGDKVDASRVAEERSGNQRERLVTEKVFQRALVTLTQSMVQQQQRMQEQQRRFMQEQQNQFQQLVRVLTVERSRVPVTAENDGSSKPMTSSAAASRSTPPSDLPRVRQPITRPAEVPMTMISVQNLAPQIPEFAGTEADNVRSWIQRVDYVARIHGASDGITLLETTSRLVGTARR